MNLLDLVDETDLKRALDEKLIVIRHAHDGQRIYNYSDAAMYTPGAWDNPAVRQCRGLIVDADDRVVARPWAKFFNHGQAEAGELVLDAAVEVTDKLDGSLGIIHLDESSEPRVATRGSFESEQAVHATAWLRDKGWALSSLDEFTPLVEVIYPGNRIVCDYGDRDELVLLGAVNIATGHYYGPSFAAYLCDWPGEVAATFPYYSLRDALAAPPRPGAEGMCVRYLDTSRIVKIKQERYLELHRIVTGLSERSVWQHLMSGADINSLLGELPDEFHAWTSTVASRLLNETESTAQDVFGLHDDIVKVLAPGWGRKEYAEVAKTTGPHRPWLFQHLDGRDPRPSILKSLRPVGDSRPRVWSEATA